MQKGLEAEQTLDKELVKSVYKDQQDIIRVVIRLYCPKGIDLDPTFSLGKFYSTSMPPRLRFDIDPQIDGVVKADCRNLPLGNESVASIMFDPPFIVGINSDNTRTGIINGRFGAYKSVEELWEMYHGALKEFHRLLKPNGILVFKCQDTISGGKQYLSHVEVINSAIQKGFYPIDLFILLADNRIIDPRGEQQHARKFHSYFIVFRKGKCPVGYTEAQAPLGAKATEYPPEPDNNE